MVAVASLTDDGGDGGGLINVGEGFCGTGDICNGDAGTGVLVPLRATNIPFEVVSQTYASSPCSAISTPLKEPHKCHEHH